jgi:hypothetical protein
VPYRFLVQRDTRTLSVKVFCICRHSLCNVAALQCVRETINTSAPAHVHGCKGIEAMSIGIRLAWRSVQEG